MKKPALLSALLFVCVLIFTVKLNAQSTFQKAYGGSSTEFGYSIKPTYDSGYVMLGSSMSFMGGYYDMVLIKFDKFHNMQWSRAYGDGPQQGNNIAYEIIQTTDSAFVISGHVNPPGDGIIIRTDKQGNVVWTRTTGEVNNDALLSVVQTQDGNIVAAGTAQHGLNNDDMLLIKMDTSGNLIWKKSYGGTGYDVAHRVVELPNGDLVMAGYTTGYGAGWQDMYVVKTDSAGNLLWTQTYGGTSDEQAHDIKQTSDGGFILSGESYGFGVGGMDVYLVKIDSAGILQWSKTYGGIDGDFGHNVIESPLGGFVVACSTFTYTRGAMLLRTDNAGNLIWARTYGDPLGLNDLHALMATPDSGYMLTGAAYVYPNDVHIYLIRTDSSGNSGCMQSTVFPAVLNAATQTGSGGSMTVYPSLNSFSLTTSSPTPQMVPFCIATDVSDPPEESATTLFPNPVADHRFTVSDGPGDATLILFNASGQVVHTQKITAYPAIVNLSSTLPAGMYVVEISGGEEITRSRIVVE